MDPTLTQIFTFVVVIATIALSMAQVFHRRAVRHEERKLELLAEIERAKAMQTGQGGDYRRFEERLRVLERIAIDSNTSLASQIEELRSLDAIEDRTQEKIS